MNYHKKIEYTNQELESERWLPIPEYENLYEVSNLGRIRTKLGKKSVNKKGLERTWKQRILKYKSETDLTYKTGYRITLWKNGESKDYLVARLVGSAFIKNELNNKEMTINHINCNRLDNHVENLEWCSLKDNIDKAIEIGVTPSKKIAVVNKKTNEELFFKSLKKASLYFKKSMTYFSSCIKRNKYENEQYKWRLI